jgi:hypothetical protein
MFRTHDSRERALAPYVALAFASVVALSAFVVYRDGPEGLVSVINAGGDVAVSVIGAVRR